MLTVIIGLPNAGKTTYSERYNNVLHLDDIGRTENVINAINQAFEDVIIEGYFGRADVRKRILHAYNGKTKCIFLDISVEQSIQRENRNRNPQILRNAARFFETPNLDEGWDEIIIIRGDDNVERISRETED